MLRKVRNHALIAMVFFVLTLSQQYAFYALNGIPIVPLTPGKYAGVYVFLFALTFTANNRLRFSFLSLILFLNFFQLSHLSFFGTQVLPAEIYLFFTQLHEITGTLKEGPLHVLVPLAFTLIPLGIGWMAHRKIKLNYGHWSMGLLVCLYFIYNPVRTYITGNTWGRQPSTRELTGMNMYLSFSYFMGKILPHKIAQKGLPAEKNSSLQLIFESGEPSKWDKIIIVIGESLTPRHMQLYGYSRPTTPFLESRKSETNFYYTTGISAGVSTDIAVAYFLNLGYGPAGSLKAAKGEHCLFKLAKKSGFKTHFISIQSAEQLRYISPYLCSGFLDDFRSLEDVSPHTPDHQAARDRDLLVPLKEIVQAEGKSVLMAHQRGSHSPWNLRYTLDAKKFEGSPDANTDHYDNSVYEFDLFWKELHELLSNSNQKILVVYLSDHGESLGDDGKWGHGFIAPVSFEVPIMLMSFNLPLPDTSQFPHYLTHYNLGLFLAREMGHSPNQGVDVLPSDYEVFGNDIDGFAGRAKIKFNNTDYAIEQLP